MHEKKTSANEWEVREIVSEKELKSRKQGMQFTSWIKSFIFTLSPLYFVSLAVKDSLKLMQTENQRNNIETIQNKRTWYIGAAKKYGRIRFNVRSIHTRFDIELFFDRAYLRQATQAIFLLFWQNERWHAFRCPLQKFNVFVLFFTNTLTLIVINHCYLNEL